MENRSESIVKLAEALSKAQGGIRGAIKDSENPYFHMTYASLASVWDAAREPLSTNGLAIIQVTKVIEGKLILETVLTHSSGEWYSSIYPINPMKQIKNEGWTPSDDPQSMGSAISYGRRYSLAAIIGIATADDDGNAATGKDTEKQKSEGTQNRPPTETITDIVTNVTQSQGTKKDKTKFTKYSVHVQNQRYSTFSSTIAKVASEAKTAGKPVTIVFHTTPYGPEIVSLTAQETPEPPQAVQSTVFDNMGPEIKEAVDKNAVPVNYEKADDLLPHTPEIDVGVRNPERQNVTRMPMSINDYKKQIEIWSNAINLNRWFTTEKNNIPDTIMPDVSKMVNERLAGFKKTKEGEKS